MFDSYGSEFKRILARYLVTAEYGVLLRLRGTSKEWFRICHKIMRQHFDKHKVIGRGSMISIDTCMCCNRKRLYESMIYEAQTPNQNFITFCYDNIQCKVTALFASVDEIKYLGGMVRCKDIANHIEPVNVLRSSGIVESNWHFINFVWPARETVYAKVMTQEIEKGCKLKDFISINPNFLRSKSKVTLTKNNFNDPEFLQKLQESFEDAGIHVDWVYENINIRISKPPASPA